MNQFLTFKQSPFKHKFLKEVEADEQLAYLDVLPTKTETVIKTVHTRKGLMKDYDKWENLSPIQHKVSFKVNYIIPIKFAALIN